MIAARQLGQLALVAAAGIVYLGLGYLITISDRPPPAAIIFGTVPLGAIALVTAWHSRTRTLSLILFSAGVLAFVMNIDNLRDHVAWLYFVQHAGAMILLGFMFGGTLGRGHADALCSRIAQFVIVKPLDANYLHYTWIVTLVWTIFFAINAVVSVPLFFFGPIEVWSAFANLVTPLLLGVMFAGEYLIRLRIMPNRAHFSITETIQAYREYSRRQNSR